MSILSHTSVSERQSRPIANPSARARDMNCGCGRSQSSRLAGRLRPSKQTLLASLERLFVRVSKSTIAYSINSSSEVYRRTSVHIQIATDDEVAGILLH